jgi:soluble lytic murein transglycosylase-like protein
LRIVALIVMLVLSAGAAMAADRSAGVMIFTAPDGTRRIVNIPAAGGLRGSVSPVPEGLAARRSALWPVVEETARNHGIDPNLIDLVIRMESGYNPRALSSKGARGVMQLMPGTASMYGVKDSFDPFDNIRGGVRYLRDLLVRFNSDIELALAAYNAGPEAVARHGGVPPYGETRNYVSSILAAYQNKSSLTTLAGGFGKPATPVAVAQVKSTPRVATPIKVAGPTRAARPVGVYETGAGKVVTNARRSGEATVARRLTLD